MKTLSPLALAVLAAAAQVHAAPFTTISTDTTYSGPYEKVPIQVTADGTLRGTADETEMVIEGGRYDYNPQVLDVQGTIRDALSLTVDGGTTIGKGGSITNIDVVTLSNTYNKHSDGGNLAVALNNQGTISNVGSLLVSGRVSNNGGTIDVDSIGNEEFAGDFVVSGGTVHTAGDAYFKEIRIGKSDLATSVAFDGTLHISSALNVQDDITVQVGNIVGAGFVSAGEAGSGVEVAGDVTIEKQISARNGGSVSVAGHAAASSIQVEVGGKITLGSSSSARIHATGDGSQISIQGGAQADTIAVGSGSTLHAGRLTAVTGTGISDFKNEGTVTLDTADLTANTFSNSGSINADTNGVSQLDHLAVSQGAWITGDMNVANFDLTGRLTIHEDSTMTVDKLGTADAAAAEITVEGTSSLDVSGDMYLTGMVNGTGTVQIDGLANMVGGYQEIRGNLRVGGLSVQGFTALNAGATLNVEEDLTLQSGSTFVVNTPNFSVGNEWILEGEAKVQMRSGSDGAEINKLTLNTSGSTYFQAYRNLRINEVSVNGYALLNTYADGGDSSLTIGSITVSDGSTVNFSNEGTYETYQSSASAERITLGNGATLINSGGSRDQGTVTTPPFDSLTIGSVEGSSAVIRNEVGGSTVIGSLTGNDNRVEVETVESGVTIERNESTGLVYQTGGTDADTLGTQGALEAAADMVLDSTEEFSTKVADGLVNGGGSATFDADGNMIFSSTGESLTMAALKQFNNATLANWRYEVNHLSERLGEVRDRLGAAGAWARIYGADTKISESVATDIKMNTVQVGADATIGGNWIVGGAFSYTSMDADISNGSADGETYSLAAYASGFFNCGGYVDIVGRIGRLSTDIDTYTSTGRLFDGSYDNTAFGLSAEVGYHWKVSDVFFVEPQAELAYGFVMGDDFNTSSGVKVEQDDFQSLVGRLGARIGAAFPENAGTFYLQASVNHEFLGDNDFDAAYRGYSKQHFTSELDGTWISYGVGLQLNATNDLSLFGSLTRANGDDYQDDYRYSVGMRYVF